MNEKQNTARALQDQQLLVTSFLCRFGWHSWTKWCVVSNSTAYQERFCSHCNIRSQKYMY